MRKVLPIGACAGVLLAGCATARLPSDALAQTAAAPTRPNCLTTGTRIALGPGECAPVSGRVYSKDDLDRTGAATTIEALKMLDPAFSW